MSAQRYCEYTQLEDSRIKSNSPIITPEDLKREVDVTPVTEHILASRTETSKIINGVSPKLLVAVGPCSIHDPEAAVDYAKRLVDLQKDLDEILIVIRAYFEKPRTVTGWKGLITDPGIDQTYDINAGLRMARELLLNLNDLGLPVTTEFLDPTIAQFISDMMTIGSVGARNATAQGNREMASGLGLPMGYKNTPEGTVEDAINALRAASHPSVFAGATGAGELSRVATTGNEDGIVILRGGKEPNYFETDIQAASDLLAAYDINTRLLIDESHGNSKKKWENQIVVNREICRQVKEGSLNIAGVLIEGHILAGSHSINYGKTTKEEMPYGQSITDQCVPWDQTKEMLEELNEAAKQRRMDYGDKYK